MKKGVHAGRGGVPAPPSTTVADGHHSTATAHHQTPAPTSSRGPRRDAGVGPAVLPAGGRGVSKDGKGVSISSNINIVLWV